MITKHEGHGSFAKQFLKEGSMGGIVKVSHLHSQYAYSSGENLSPRSVLEQRALSGLAIAIDLEEKMKLSLTHENAILGRFLSKQSILQMSIQEAQAKENLTVSRSISREGVHDMIYMNDGERETISGESSVGLKMVISMHRMSNQEGKAHENLLMGRSLSMMHMKDEEREAVSGGGLRGAASLEGERKQGKKVSSSEDPPLLPSACRSSYKRGQSTYWLHELGHAQPSFPACTSSTKDSIFYCATAKPPPSTIFHHVADDVCQPCSPVEDFLKCCFFCKRRLGAGKDIYMYRGDQAFCSVECRYEQIAKDEL